MVPTPTTTGKRPHFSGAIVTPPSARKARRLLKKGWCSDRCESGYQDWCCCFKARLEQRCQVCHDMIREGHCIEKQNGGWTHVRCEMDDERNTCRSLYNSFVPQQVKQLEAPSSPLLLESGTKTKTEAEDDASAKAHGNDEKSQSDESNQGEGENFCLTKEQEHIMAYEAAPTEFIRINALAGCGKTTTVAFLCNKLVEPNRLGPKSRILYVVFGKSNQIEARKSSKFPKNVEILTCHAFAKRKVLGTGNSVKPLNDYDKERVATLLRLEEFVHQKFHQRKRKQQTAIRKGIATIVVKTISSFQQSSDSKVKESHLPWNATTTNHTDRTKWKKEVDKSRYISWAQQLYDLVEKACRENENSYLDGVPHDAYLKYMQLHVNELAAYDVYDVIIVDEAQDLTPCQADLLWGEHFTSQGTRVYLVGDQNQRIYAFRGAKDNFEKTCVSREFPLQGSFRVGENIAEVANALLSLSGSSGRLRGCAAEVGSVLVGDEIDVGVVLCRTRNGMIRYLEEQRPDRWSFYSVGMSLPKNSKHEYKELEEFITAGMGEADEINDFFAELNNPAKQMDGEEKVDSDQEDDSDSSVFQYKKRDTIQFHYRGEVFSNKDELIEFCEDEGDTNMMRKIALIKDFHDRNKGRNRSIVHLFDELRKTYVKWRKHTTNVNDFCGVALATAHSSEGLEFDHVLVYDDFRFGWMGTQQPEAFLSKQFLRETLNLAYVAVTRAKISLRLCTEAYEFFEKLKAQASEMEEEELDVDLLDIHERFESKWQEFENSSKNSVTFDDIPWPAGPQGNEFALIPTMSREEQKKRIRENLKRFYKFYPSHAERVITKNEEEQALLKEKVDSVCRLLQKYWSVLRSPVDEN